MPEHPIPRDTSRAVGNALRFQMLHELNKAFAYSGLSVETVASRLAWSPRRVRRTLGGKSELTLRGIAELAWAIDGALLEISFTPKDSV